MSLKHSSRTALESELVIDILESISDAIATVDKDSRLVYVNKGYEKLFDTNRSELIGKSIWDGAPASFDPLFLMYYERAMSCCAPASFEHFMPALDKKFDVRLYPMRGGLTILFHDKTARWHAEELYRLALFLLDRLNENVFIVSTDGRLFHVSDNVSRLLGYTRDELICMNIFDIDPGITVDGWKDRFSDLKSRGHATFASGLKTKNGELIGVKLEANYVKIYDKEYYCITTRDINEHDQAVEDRPACEPDLARSQQLARMGSYDWDIVNNRAYCSSEFYALFGLAPSKYIDFETFLNAVHPEDREFVKKANLDAVYNGAPYNIDFRIIRKDGAVRIMHSEGELSLDKDGKPCKLYEFMQDVTERKRTELELQKAKARTEMYNDLLGHDINNMNQIGIGYLELAIDKLGVNEEGKRLLSKPLEALINSSKLIEDVRKLQSIQAGEVGHKAMDVNKVLLDVINAYSFVKDWSITINYLPKPGCMVMANELLRDVFSNIIGNAIKHSSGPLEVVIDVSRVADNGIEYCKVSIGDNGPGIPDDIKSKLFARFQRGDTRTSGKGLGLYIVKTLVDDYDGKVWVEDSVSGDHTKGCRFIVMLPSVE